MARAVHPAKSKTPEGIEGEMRSFGREQAIHEVHRPPFEEEGVYEPGANVREVAKGAVAGAIAGLAAGWVMVEFQKIWSKVEKAAGQRDSESKNLEEHGVPEHRAKNLDEQHDQPDDATIKTAEAITGLFGHRLTREEKKIAGPAVHYAFAVGSGVMYGAAAELAPQASSGFGSAFGAALFLVADEIAVPAFGLSPNVQGVPLSKHVYGFASHLVYGVATEALRRPIRKALG
ncbi:MAG: hypothetical protein JWO13_1419 [Acidobacteriales bacterium]|nr:hypothetical protein [Terriglobales bacterium]